MQYQGPACVAVLELRMWDGRYSGGLGTVTSPIPNRPVQEGRCRNVGVLDPDTKEKKSESNRTLWKTVTEMQVNLRSNLGRVYY
jgi:hypothetical protein